MTRSRAEPRQIWQYGTFLKGHYIIINADHVDVIEGENGVPDKIIICEHTPGQELNTATCVQSLTVEGAVGALTLTLLLGVLALDDRVREQIIARQRRRLVPTLKLDKKVSGGEILPLDLDLVLVLEAAARAAGALGCSIAGAGPSVFAFAGRRHGVQGGLGELGLRRVARAGAEGLFELFERRQGAAARARSPGARLVHPLPL